ncbi:cell adhesion molecule 3 [Diretmus argenteus]
MGKVCGEGSDVGNIALVLPRKGWSDNKHNTPHPSTLTPLSSIPAPPARPAGSLSSPRSPCHSAVTTTERLADDDDPLQPVTSDETVPVGGTVTLTCRVAESDNSSLQWSNTLQQTLYFGGKREHSDMVEPIPGDPTYRVVSELTLEVNRTDDNAVIACVVEHDSLSPQEKRSEQLLRVLYSPNVHILPVSDLPREGEPFYLQCMGNSNPEPTSYIWKKKDGEEDGELPPLAKVEGAILSFEKLNKSDNGVYLCHADNGIGKSTGDYQLLVQDPTDPDAPFPPFTASPPPPISPSTLPSNDDDTGSGTEPSSTSSPADLPPSALPESESDPTASTDAATTLSNDLFPDLALTPSSSPPSPTPPPSAAAPSSSSPASSLTHSVSVRLNGVYTFTEAADNVADPTAMSTSSGVDHAVIGGVVAVIVFILLCLLIVLGRYLIRHKGTYLTHEAKGSDDAPDADTAIINAEGGHSGAEDKKEYFI